MLAGTGPSGLPTVRTLVRVVALIWMLFAATDAAFAHASLLEVNPADGTALAQSPETLTLRFNEPVSPTVVRIIDPTGKEVTPASVEALNETVTVRLANRLPEGTSLLSYRIISADGHPVGGTVSFSVGHPSGNATMIAAVDPTLAKLIWLTKVVIYFGLFAGVGGVFFRVWIARETDPASPVARVITGVIVCAVLASVLALGLQGLDALGEPIGRLTTGAVWAAGLSTTLATSLGLGGLAFLCAYFAGRSIPQMAAKILALSGLIAVGLSLAASGHAGTIEPQWVSRSAVFLHATAVAFWVGALLPLVSIAAFGGPQLVQTLKLFSFWAIPVVVVLVVAGTGIAVAQLGTVSSLWLTDYGHVLMAKLVAVALLLSLAGANYLWLTPAVAAGRPDARAWLRWSIRGEIALVIVILGLVALWRFTQPPRALLAARAAPAHVHIHQLRAMVDLSVTPGQAGPVTIMLQFQSGDFGPLTPKEVTVSLAKPESGIEAIERDAKLEPGDIWRAGPLVLPLSGQWHVRVDALISDFDKVILEDVIEISH